MIKDAIKKVREHAEYHSEVMDYIYSQLRGNPDIKVEPKPLSGKDIFKLSPKSPGDSVAIKKIEKISMAAKERFSSLVKVERGSGGAVNIIVYVI